MNSFSYTISFNENDRGSMELQKEVLELVKYEYIAEIKEIQEPDKKIYQLTIKTDITQDYLTLKE